MRYTLGLVAIAFLSSCTTITSTRSQNMQGVDGKKVIEICRLIIYVTENPGVDYYNNAKITALNKAREKANDHEGTSLLIKKIKGNTLFVGTVVEGSFNFCKNSG